MQHRDTKAAGKEERDDLCDLIQTELNKLPEQHRVAAANHLALAYTARSSPAIA